MYLGCPYDFNPKTGTLLRVKRGRTKEQARTPGVTGRGAGKRGSGRRLHLPPSPVPSTLSTPPLPPRLPGRFPCSPLTAASQFLLPASAPPSPLGQAILGPPTQWGPHSVACDAHIVVLCALHHGF